MFHHPTRAGTRGGQGLFKWDDVKDDKDESGTLTATETLDAELKLIRQQEQEALAEALGYTSGAKRTGGVTKSEIQRLVKLDFEGADGSGGADDGEEAGLGYKSVKGRTALADGISAQASDGPYRDEEGGEWVAAAAPKAKDSNRSPSPVSRDDRKAKKDKKDKREKKDKKEKKAAKKEKSEKKRRRPEGAEIDDLKSEDGRQRRRSRADGSLSPVLPRRDSTTEKFKQLARAAARTPA
ncbi:hypothetical protein HDU86_003868 [Geranomyces michiganensis]|nr:hypothetical protein HDU86_003868 [Geranomyces michiganensis]